MRLGLIADDTQKEWITTKFYTQPVTIHSIEDVSAHQALNSCNALFILKENVLSANDLPQFTGPIFFNEVIKTLAELRLPKNYHRINGWHSFIERDKVEIASNDPLTAKQICNQLNWETVFCPDIPGFISARIVAMIINEAWFAFGDHISSMQDIDLAMKLGTNYPYGPFEWGKIIGLQRVYNLLKTLSATNDRYLIAPALTHALT